MASDRRSYERSLRNMCTYESFKMFFSSKLGGRCPKGLRRLEVNWKILKKFPLNICLCSFHFVSKFFLFAENTRQWIYLKMFKSSWYSLSSAFILTTFVIVSLDPNQDLRSAKNYWTCYLLLVSYYMRKKIAYCCATDFSLLNLPKGKSLGRSKPATNS